MDAKDYLRKPYARRLTPDEGGGFTTTIQEFPGCIADGDDAATALKNLEQVAESWIEAALELGQAIPEPIELHGYSGKIALRLPRGLHKQVAELSSSEGTSINQLLVTAIANYLGGQQAFRKLAREFVQSNVGLKRVTDPKVLSKVVTDASVTNPTHKQASKTPA